MGEILNPHKVEVFDDEEPYDNDKVNANTRKLNKALPLFASHPAIPEGESMRVFTGLCQTFTGAGGENRVEPNATSPVGIGGFWFGHGPLPGGWKGIAYVNLIHVTGGDQDAIAESFASSVAIISVNTTRIKYKARKLDNSNWANAYGGIQFYIMVVGW